MHTYNIKCLIQDQITFDELWMCFQNLWDPEMVGQHGRRNLNGEFTVTVLSTTRGTLRPPTGSVRTPSTPKWEGEFITGWS